MCFTGELFRELQAEHAFRDAIVRFGKDARVSKGTHEQPVHGEEVQSYVYASPLRGLESPTRRVQARAPPGDVGQAHGVSSTTVTVTAEVNV